MTFFVPIYIFFDPFASWRPFIINCIYLNEKFLAATSYNDCHVSSAYWMNRDELILCKSYIYMSKKNNNANSLIIHLHHSFFPRVTSLWLTFKHSHANPDYSQHYNSHHREYQQHHHPAVATFINYEPYFSTIHSLLFHLFTECSSLLVHLRGDASWP